MGEGHQTAAVPVEILVQFAHYVRFVSVHPLKNRQRFYLLTWQASLEGTVALVCTWVRLGSPGRSRVVFVSNQQAIEMKLIKLMQRRFKHGYQVTEWQ